MIRNKHFLIILLFLLPLAGSADTLKTISEKDYAGWQTLGPVSISGDGQWISWRITLNEGDDTLYISNPSTSVLYKYPLSSAGVFSSDSKWAASRIGYSEKQLEKMTEEKKTVKYKTRLLSLESGKERILENTESFAFTKDAGHIILAGYANDNKTKDIFIHNLKNGTTKNIGNVAEYAVNKAGNRLAYIISAADKSGNGVELMDLNNYNISFLDNDTSVYRNLVWEKEGNALMFYKSFTDSTRLEENHIVFAVRNIYGKPEIRSFDPSSDTIRFPGKLYVKESFKPQISDNCRIIYFGAHNWTVKEKNSKKSSEKPKIPGVDIWHWKDDPIQPRQQKTYDTDRNFTYLFAWNPDKNSLVRLSGDSLRRTMLTGDGTNVLVMDDTPYRPAFREAVSDYYLADPLTGKRKLLLQAFSSVAASSPAGKYVYYFMEKNWWVYDIRKDIHVNLTGVLETVRAMRSPPSVPGDG